MMTNNNKEVERTRMADQITKPIMMAPIRGLHNISGKMSGYRLAELSYSGPFRRGQAS